MADNMPVGYPSTEQFPTGRVSQQDTEWHWQRSPGSGGKNYGHDFAVPAGHFVVGFNVLEHSRIRADGNPDIRVMFTPRGILNVPVAVHNGIRLEPQGLGGSGASYKFTMQIRYVTEADWYAVALGERGLTESAINSFVTQSEADPEEALTPDAKER